MHLFENFLAWLHFSHGGPIEPFFATRDLFDLFPLALQKYWPALCLSVACLIWIGWKRTNPPKKPSDNLVALMPVMVWSLQTIFPFLANPLAYRHSLDYCFYGLVACSGLGFVLVVFSLGLFLKPLRKVAILRHKILYIAVALPPFFLVLLCIYLSTPWH